MLDFLYFFLKADIVTAGINGLNSFNLSKLSFTNLNKSFGLILDSLGNPNSILQNLYNFVYSKYEPL